MMTDSVSANANELSPEDERLLDLLVDGELDEPRRKKLLLSFEDKPSGWRRCALAFLEAQSWGGSFKSLLQERPEPARASVVAEPASLPTAASSHEMPSPAVAAERTWSVRPLSGLAMAASMIVAFTLGLALRNAYAPSNGAPQGVISSPGGIADSLASPPFVPTMRNMPDAAADNVRLVVDGDGDPQLVDVPLVDDPALVDSYPFRNESAIPAEILHQLEQMGHRVEHQRRLAPVELPDGRRLYLPVEDVKIVPVRRQMY